ncbi:hypothetical protein RQP46_007595 [Phenoliferia psychrophenolica]
MPTNQTTLAAPLSLSASTSTLLSVALAGVPVLMVLQRQFALVRYYTRLALFLTGLATCSVWGVVVSIAYGLMGRRSDSNWRVARSFHWMVAPLVGFRFTVEGEEHLDQNKPAVVIGNHQTMIDILYLGRIFPKGCSIMAKREVQYMPLLGQFMTLSNAVFINRTNRADAVAVFAKVAARMKDQALSLFIFPEGTRSASATPTLLPFKKGAFHLAVAAQLPIVPIVCENYAAAYSAQEKRFEGGDLIIKEDIAALVDKTRGLMLAAIEELAERRAEANRLKAVFATKEDDEDGDEDGTETTPLVSAVGH